MNCFCHFYFYITLEKISKIKFKTIGYNNNIIIKNKFEAISFYVNNNSSKIYFSKSVYKTQL